MDDRLAVPFAGPGAGEGPLTWGQLQCWRTMVDTGSSDALGATFPCPPGTTLEQLADDVRFWMSRYAAMRSRVRHGRAGAVTQVVSAAGTLSVPVVPAGGDAAGTARDLLDRWLAEPYDYERDWPLRLGLVARAGSPLHAVVAVHHLAVDRTALDVMVRERAAGPVRRPAPQPLELAARERTEPGARPSRVSLRFWQQRLREVPAARPPAAAPDGHRRWRVVRDSAPLSGAVRTVAAGLGTGTGVVLLGAFVLALGEVTGADPVVTQTVVDNRFRPGLADIVCPVAQSGLLVVAVGGRPLRELVPRVARASLAASKHAYYDPAARDELLRTAAEGREEVGVLFNDRRRPVAPGSHSAAAGPPAGPDRPIGAFGGRLLVHVDNAPGGVRLTADVDTAYLAVPAARAVLARMEAAVVEAAGPVTGS